MTIKTLECIHFLLKREVNSLKVDYAQARDARDDCDPESSEYPALEEVCRVAYDVYSDHLSALREFESMDWH